MINTEGEQKARFKRCDTMLEDLKQRVYEQNIALVEHDYRKHGKNAYYGQK